MLEACSTSALCTSRKILTCARRKKPCGSLFNPRCSRPASNSNVVVPLRRPLLLGARERTPLWPKGLPLLGCSPLILLRVYNLPWSGIKRITSGGIQTRLARHKMPDRDRWFGISHGGDGEIPPQPLVRVQGLCPVGFPTLLPYRFA